MTKDEAITWAGSQSELARRLGLDQSTVCGWRGDPPYVHQVRIQDMSGGALAAAMPVPRSKPRPEMLGKKPKRPARPARRRGG